MKFDPDNHIVQLCAKGMEIEGEPEKASALFLQAWHEASNDTEKFIAAHYVARHQTSIADKLKWDEIALQAALNIGGDEVKETYPSLYLNIAKCYEDLGDVGKALKNYEAALSYADYLPADGYGNMIRSGIAKGIERIK